ncbi:MAG: hypothetical protein VX035_02270, partial [Planctomycetota bacterium]|nr:hypothetical protein [Planctomycetota bacterium]
SKALPTGIGFFRVVFRQLFPESRGVTRPNNTFFCEHCQNRKKHTILPLGIPKTLSRQSLPSVELR